ncbi:MAG: DEAD/DEAH box helicase, partial [Myxococcota bacterium]|nr:DEAD/DEAH box helicase [Myxococcota bacterium]
RQVQSCLLYGGQPVGPQIQQLRRRPQLIVGTPGRVIDHIERGTLELSQLRFFTLDEADEMLRMGFIDDVERILRETPKSRQTALFSATMPPEIAEIARRHLKEDQLFVKIQGESRTSADVEQSYLLVHPQQKFDALMTLLELESDGCVLVFARTRRDTTNLADQLQARGYAAEALNGEMSQELREGVVRRLREGRVQLIVATDVAARGLDINGISQVINYDLPQDSESYIHRIGRTGRAGRQGHALLLITPRERHQFSQLQRQLKGSQLKALTLPSRERLLQGRKAALLAQIEQSIQVLNGEDVYREVLDELIQQEQSLEAVALAALKLATHRRPLSTDALPAPIEALDWQKINSRRRVMGAPRPGRDVLSLQLGRRHGLRAKDIVGAVANEAQIDGRQIGTIQIGEVVSLVELPSNLVHQVLERMQGKNICGQRAQFGKWDGSEIEEARGTLRRDRIGRHRAPPPEVIAYRRV